MEQPTGDEREEYAVLTRVRFSGSLEREYDFAVRLCRKKTISSFLTWPIHFDQPAMTDPSSARQPDLSIRILFSHDFVINAERQGL